MNWATSEDAQNHLIVSAKREAVRELFGEMIWSLSEMKDLVVTRDELQSFSAGFVRVRGIPEFFNGASLGETCVIANFYLLQDDIVRLQPRPVSKRMCGADPRLSSGEVRSLAERQARIQAVRDFEPGLQDLDDEYVLRLLHEARITDAGFIPDTLTYCATAEGIIHPIELLAASRSKEGSKRTATVPTPDLHVHVVFHGQTLDRAEAVAARLSTLGYEVTKAEAENAMIRGWNRLYHHPSDKQIAIKIQGECRIW